jgi:hypothetical protein
MTANQIRGFSASYPDATFIVLQEIAAQLAELKELLHDIAKGGRDEPKLSS